MTKPEFFEIFAPLISRHPQTFTSDVSDLVYKLFKSLTKDQGRDVVSKLMLQSRMAPVDSDFREVIRLVRDNRHHDNVVPLRTNTRRSTIEAEWIPKLFAIASGNANKEETKNTENLLWKVAHQGVRCRLCLDEGYVHAVLRSTPNAMPYAFLCSCSAAKFNRENLPHWRSDLSNTYRVILNGPDLEGA